MNTDPTVIDMLHVFIPIPDQEQKYSMAKGG